MPRHAVKITLILMLISQALFAELSSSQLEMAKQMAAQNPSLLHTPEAQNLLKQQSENSIPSDTATKIEKPSNEITFEQKKIEAVETNFIQPLSDDQKIDTKSYRLNPQSYKNNDQALFEIRSGQMESSKKQLERFSVEFFRNKNQVLQKNINAPTDYVINRGDTITFWVYGATNKQHELQVNNQGNINIPDVGPVRVAGEKFGEVKELLTNYLSSSYKNSDVVVDLNSFSTAQVTLTGFVNTPGIFNTTSVSSVKDILIEAQGVSDVGSVRNIQVKRAGTTIATIDYYDLLTRGLDRGDVVLQPDDTIYVPRAHGLIQLAGAVNKEAIFEIKPHEKLGRILRVAGGVKSEADGLQIHIKRYDNNRQIKYHKITLREANTFTLKDGDEVYVGEMGITNERYIEIVGNVIQEGKKEFSGDTIKLSTLLKREIKGNNLDQFFLPNTQLDYAVIKRVAQDTTLQMFNVNLRSILDGYHDFTLQNRDILYVYNKLDTSVNPYVTIEQAMTEEEKEFQTLSAKEIKEKEFTSQQIKDLNKTDSILMTEGKHLYTEGMTLTDLINAAGIQNPFDKERVKIISYDEAQQKSDVQIVNYVTNPNFVLKAFDKVYLFSILETHPIPTASIVGEVIKPGRYEVSEAMTLASFIESAGGLSEKAYPKECEIIRYHIENGERNKKIFNIEMDKITSFMIQPHDEINIRRIPNWHERQTITLSGEIKFPGTYVIHNGEKLSSVIERAGGFTEDAFLYGAVFSRQEIAKMQKESLKVELSKLKEQVVLASLRAAGSKSMNAISITESINAVESLIQEAEKLTPIGRIAINLGYDEDADCDGYGYIGSKHVSGNFKGSASDLTLKDKDTLHIPSFNDTVVVSGEVMNPMALTYLGEGISDYIAKSGGLTEVADTDHIYVMHANGEAQKATLGSYLFSSNNVTVKKGDIIIVPKKLMFQRGIDLVSEVADIFYKLTLTVAAMHTVGAL